MYMLIIQNDSRDRLVREVEIMRRLRHPNIIRLVEAFDTPEQVCKLSLSLSRAHDCKRCLIDGGKYIRTVM